jgi:zinc and cadmium transporter
MTSLQYTLFSVFIVSLVSLAGVFILSLKTDLLKKMLMYLVSFSTGALLGNVFLHLIPEVIKENQQNLIWVLGGILLSFVIEKFIHWRHCHDLECATHVHPVGPLVIMGDAVHNILDGILIATAYLVSIPVGISTTIAVLLHEIPQELGDFAILIHSGMSKRKALLFNFFSALTAFIGVGIVIGLAQSIANIEMILLPLAAGNFLYIAGSDLIPELHKDTRIKGAAIQLTMMIVGIGLMYGLSL